MVSASRKSQKALDRLRTFESRNVTFIDPDGSWPIVWDRAQGVHVWDLEGRKYLDLTAAFGVAAAGHANRRVVAAGQKQMARLLHAMGDVHPHELKARLARELSRVTFERWEGKAKGRRPKAKGQRPKSGKTIFCNSGFEAVEAALKTAMLATGKAEVIAFEGAYHGLGYGALNATHRSYFRSPFRQQLREFGHFLPFPNVSRPTVSSVNGTDPGARPDTQPGAELERLEKALREVLQRSSIGAILVEPIQVRGGINIPPPAFLPLLRRLCDEFGALLILDEIYTGFGRTGRWFACEHAAVVPDVICLGKALAGGFPLSACVGGAELMDRAWPPSEGEAIHTSTFLGHPVGCAMALAQLKEISQGQLVRRAEELGHRLLEALSRLQSEGFKIEFRGQGLLAGVELKHADGSPATAIVLRTVKGLLRRGFIYLPEGEHANVVGFTPPLTISRKQLQEAVAALEEVLLGNEGSQGRRADGRGFIQK